MNRSLVFHQALLWCAFLYGPFFFFMLEGSFAAAPTTERPLQSNLTVPRSLRITDWPGWRGPNADGVADDRNLPIRWTKRENVRWSVTLPGWGTSSPVVYGNLVFVTSETRTNDQKSLLTLCFDREKGRELWRHDFGFGVDQRTHEKSNLAANTLRRHR